ncbi:50S ribosomal protein L40e [Candidatus Woesearchaeota archaeon]|nr:MAG: 50S ribosomal protein L40e [Candidatus Woesearchaeota archaeon]
MVKFPEAAARLTKNIFICRRCKSKIRTTNMKVLAGKVRCRKCTAKVLRPMRKK